MRPPTPSFSDPKARVTAEEAERTLMGYDVAQLAKRDLVAKSRFNFDSGQWMCEGHGGLSVKHHDVFVSYRQASEMKLAKEMFEQLSGLKVGFGGRGGSLGAVFRTEVFGRLSGPKGPGRGPFLWGEGRGPSL